ncbi:MAG: CehA/McbA family metallohydrolase [Polyangiaceae bacterium]
MTGLPSSAPPTRAFNWHAPRYLGIAGLLLSLAAEAGCVRPASHSAIEVAMTSAYRPASDAPTIGNAFHLPGGDVVLAGDMHCHVSPPDHPQEASRGPEETVRLAREEKLDFVVLTPHVPALFFEDAGMREAVVAAQNELKRAVGAASDGRTIFIAGMEYTDHAYGHVGASFADLATVLAEVPAEEAHAHPGRFFERFVANGGVLVINHPLSVPIDSSFAMARADLSWRPFTSPDPVPEEIATVTRLAQGFEVYNMVVTHLRDRYLLHDTERTLVATLAREDAEIVRQGRRIAPVGGTDSHVSYLRPTTYVRASARTERAIRDAIVGGRTCVRAPEACSFEVRATGAAWNGVGASLPATATIEARATGGDVEVLVNGRTAASVGTGEIASVTMNTGSCSVVRARVGEGYSAPIYVGCSF